ncbi:hypothetical protein SLUN_34970 [Streptomyces lunaelactis]|uniref:Integral membrane protein n=1 Tax=Streptomyces lunaelactis TaxID=1535768 RepID=A0A2R4TC08_9ACTN|nr:hypothetical protein [Streptomyces lunaelactis]AVZ76644.1 hypothetical protein SLUN_34970 [Streptomyces lunaelactis]NUK83164.1 hypothetical protein [Streptomyces lunaelactis]
MRASRALAVAAAACVAVGLSAPLAAAGGDNNQNTGPINISVNPQAVHPGGILTITVQGCNRGGTVSSSVFPTTNLSGNQGGRATATARVNDNATPGQYHLSVRCNDNPQVATQQFTVLPARGAQGGLGGSVGPSSTEMALGGGLVAAAAVGGTLFIARRRRVISGKV